jgi:transposase
LTDENGLLVKLAITPGEANDITVAADLLADIGEGQILLGDKAYDADWLRAMLARQGAWANIPLRANRKKSIPFSASLYKARNVIERFFNKIKWFRRIATRYEKLGSHFVAMVKLAAIRLRLRFYESTT